MRSTYDRSRVTQFGGLEPEGHQFEGRVTLLGSTPGQIHVKAYAWTLVADEDRPRWHEVDHLVDCTVEERQDGGINVNGLSTKMMVDGEMSPRDSDVRWEVEWKPCPTCR